MTNKKVSERPEVLLVHNNTIEANEVMKMLEEVVSVRLLFTESSVWRVLRYDGGWPIDEIGQVKSYINNIIRFDLAVVSP